MYADLVEVVIADIQIEVTPKFITRIQVEVAMSNLLLLEEEYENLKCSQLSSFRKYITLRGSIYFWQFIGGGYFRDSKMHIVQPSNMYSATVIHCLFRAFLMTIPFAILMQTQPETTFHLSKSKLRKFCLKTVEVIIY